MQTTLLGRSVTVPTMNSIGEIVASEMKQPAGGNCFLVLTVLFDDGTLKTLAERDVIVDPKDS